MIGKLVLSGFLIAGIAVAHGQKLAIGPKIGGSISIVNIDDVIGDIRYSTGLPGFGWHAGMFVRTQAPWIYFEPSLMFTNSSGTINVDSVTLSEIVAMKYNKIDIPVVLGFRMKQVFRIEGGIVGSILLSADARNDVSGTYTTVKTDYKTATVGWHVGFGFDIKWFSINLAYEDNLSAFGEKIDQYSTDIRNSQVKITLGFMIIRKGKHGVGE